MASNTAATHPNREAFPKGMSGPSLRALANARIRSMADVARWREADLAQLHGMGPKAVGLLKAALAAEGTGFRG